MSAAINKESPLEEQKEPGEPLVEMESVRVKYGDRTVLGGWKSKVELVENEGFWWTVRRGERWGIFGPNGYGKTTVLSLITSDHPQTYSLPIKLFGRSRLPQEGKPGISIFDIQARIGHSSPEIHAFFPKTVTLRQTIENAWADTFLSKPRLDSQTDQAVDVCLRTFRGDLEPSAKGSRNDQDGTDDLAWADSIKLADLSFSAQRLALFLRAIVKRPDLVILDEAFSGMDGKLRDKCMLFLEHGESLGPGGKDNSVVVGGLENRQALLVLSHVLEEIPELVREWVRLPEAGTGMPARFGRFSGPGEGNAKNWDQIWLI
jgi:ABC-type molybdenum transport system ATPase subunit/photorepair protein PhrA